MSPLAFLATLLVATAPAPPLPPEVEAFALFEEGEAAYRDRRFSAAATFFERAHAVHPEPPYLFNQGLALTRAERYAEAEAIFSLFLEIFPGTPKDAEVQERLAEVQRLRALAGGRIRVETIPAGVWARAGGRDDLACHSPCELLLDPGEVDVELIWQDHREVISGRVDPGQTWRITTDLLAASRATPDRRGPSRLGSWISWGVGGAALATGVAYAIATDSAYGQARTLEAASPLSDADFTRFESLKSDVRTRSTIADVAWSVAITGAVVGTILWLSADADDDAADPREEVTAWRD